MVKILIPSKSMKVMIQYAVPMLMLVTSEPVSQNKNSPRTPPSGQMVTPFLAEASLGTGEKTVILDFHILVKKCFESD